MPGLKKFVPNGLTSGLKEPKAGFKGPFSCLIVPNSGLREPFQAFSCLIVPNSGLREPFQAREGSS